MLEIIHELPPGITGLKATEKITKEDYERVFEPLLDAARREGRRLRFLYDLSTDFDGFTASAAWEDAKIGLRSLRLFEGCAIVSDIGWIRESTRLIGFVMPCPVRVFETSERDKAVDWLGTLPGKPATSFRLLPESGVLVIEITGALRAHDFDALSVTVDSWIEAHGTLKGIVLHAHTFPGWESFESLLRHVQFVRDHHKKVEKVALAADGKLAGLAAHLSEHFVKADVKTFAYDELESAIHWTIAATS